MCFADPLARMRLHAVTIIRNIQLTASSVHFSMPDLSSYTGKPLNAFAENVIRALEAENFTVTATQQGPKKDQRKTLRITWRGVYIGLMSEGLWGRKSPYACLYRFPKDRGGFAVAKAPEGFDKDAFARQHGCDPDLLHVHSDYSGSYLWVQDEVTSLVLMRDWARRIDEVFFKSAGSQNAAHIQQDLRTIMEDGSKSETQRLTEVAARLGQGKFRADLEQEFGNACAATRLAVLPALRASHIVPWRGSESAQRLDPKNGLLLSANIDALFDRYMITFRPDGKLEVSKSLAEHDLEKLGPLQDLQVKPCDRRADYLRQHNREFERLERERCEYVRVSAR